MNSFNEYEQKFNIIFSQNLNIYLEKNQMTKKDLAEKLNVSAQSVTNWTKGIKIPRMGKVDDMCKIFNCKRKDLLNSQEIKDNMIYATDSEQTLLEAFRSADSLAQAMVYRALGIEEQINDKKPPTGADDPLK